MTKSTNRIRNFSTIAHKMSNFFECEYALEQKNEICNSDWLKSKTKKKNFEQAKALNVIDLFCGCGGLSLGIEEGLNLNKTKSNFLLALDSNPTALEVYAKNFNISTESLKNIDITEIITETTNNNYTNVDLLVAGPPCQGHSSLNNHTRSNDQRNLLYLTTLEFIKQTLPKVSIIENVFNIINDQNKVIEQSQNLLKNWGYEVYELSLDAYLHFGLPQTRKRHLLIAILGESFDTTNILSEVKEKCTLKDYIGDISKEYKSQKSIFYTPSLSKETNQQRIRYLFENNLYDLPNEMRPKCHQEEHSYKSMYGRLQ